MSFLFLLICPVSLFIVFAMVGKLGGELSKLYF